MPRFRYVLDPLFLTGCGAYAINRWAVLPHTSSPFLHGQFNDLWLIPCALPPVLWLHRKLGLRSHDAMPQLSEIFWHLAFWTILCEGIGPLFIRHAHGDPRDAIAYAVGAVIAAGWWRWGAGRKLEIRNWK